MNRILLITLLIAGCSAPVTRLRDISESAQKSSVKTEVSRFIHCAENAAWMGNRVVPYPVDSAMADRVTEGLIDLDHRFNIKAQPIGSKTILIVGW